MKKLLIFVILSILSIFFYITQLRSIPNGNLNQQALYLLQESGCILCHDRNIILPFYSKFPIIGNIITSDVENGRREFDMSSILSDIKLEKSIPETKLAKIEYVINNSSMPPLSFTTFHWYSFINNQKKLRILDWIKSERKKYYPDSCAAPEFKSFVIQPIGKLPAVNPQKVKLGDLLFHDKRLSFDDSLSCASCHELNTAGVDKLKYSTGIKSQKGGINAPTVFNSYFNHLQFWDGRAKDLADQASGPPTNPIEMGSPDWDYIVQKLKKDQTLKKIFDDIYPSEGLSQATVCDAIAEFEKTLITPNSRLDKFLMGDKTALTKEELQGFKLFLDNGCSNCHVGVALGGQSFEKMGLRTDYFEDRGNFTDADNGRFNYTKNNLDKEKFKVPTLRNVALTPPYFHDGTVQTLTEAVEKMALYQRGKYLSKKDIQKIVKFLDATTGEFNGNLLN